MLLKFEFVLLVTNQVEKDVVQETRPGPESFYLIFWMTYAIKKLIKL